MSIKAVIFDLDDTLFDCSGQLVKEARKRAAQAMKNNGLQLSVKENLLLQEKFYKKFGPNTDVYSRIAKKFKAKNKQEMIDEAVKAYNSDEVGKITLFSDAIPLIKQLKKNKIKIIILTSGIYSRQMKKIDLLGLKKYVDLIFVHDLDRGNSKEALFIEVMNKFKFVPEEILSVGDRVYSEIRISNKLGLNTVRILKGRFKDLKPKHEFEIPDFNIKNLKEILKIIDSINSLKNQLKVVALGGGTGVPTILDGMKEITSDLTAIVAVTDSGRSTGKIRKEFDIPAMGDIRNCLVALSSEEKTLVDLFNYRFEKGELEGHAFGNLFITALTKTTGSFKKALAQASKILSVKGKVFASTIDNVQICAEFVDGEKICGEFDLRMYKKSPVKKVWLSPKNAKTTKQVIKSIIDADLIVLGPGSLFTSVISNLLVPDIKKALQKSNAKKVYVCNIMTQEGQTDNFTASMHVKEIQNYLGKHLDFVILNSGKPTKTTLEKYAKENAFLIKNDIVEVKKLGVMPIVKNLLEKQPEKKELWQKKYLLRHDSKKLTKVLNELV